MITIKWLNPIYCEIDAQTHEFLKPAFSYPSVWFRQTQYRKVRETYQKCVTKKVKGQKLYHFHTGLLTRARNFCVENGVGVTIDGDIERLPADDPLNWTMVGDKTLRDDQAVLVIKACRRQRGVLVAPTRTGKTIVMIGIINRYPDANILILCHRSSIIGQTKKKLEDAGYKDVGAVVGGKSQINRVTVGTIQSMKPFISAHNYTHFWDIVIVDEAHHVSKFDGQYAFALERITAPVRLGFTATMPIKEEAKMALEALIGPKIGEVSMEEGIELGLLMKPKIRVLKVDYKQRIKDLRRYADVYDQGIVRNNTRHRQVMEEVQKYILLGKTVLILVTKIAHGQYLQQVGQAMTPKLDTEFIQGSVGSEIREGVQDAFNEKKIKCVIATAAWKEGIDIPSLDVVFNAGGGKSEIATLQSTARCLTKDEGKDQAIIHDVFDPSHHYLVDHFGHRISLYTEKGWM